MAITKIQIEANRFAEKFLKPEWNFNKAVSSAYADMARHTMRCEKGDTAKLKSWKESCISEVKEILKDFVGSLVGISSQTDFDTKHRDVCRKIADVYNQSGSLMIKPFTHGQAQKLVNMFLKYLYIYDIAISEITKDKTSVLEYISNKRGDGDELFLWFHATVDASVISKAKEKCNVSPRSSVWSTWDESTYEGFQNEMRSKMGAKYLKSNFYWELDNWQ